MYEIAGIGMDLCDIQRMQENLGHEHFLDRVFTKKEQAYFTSKGRMAAQSMAAIWAGKEAVLKAFGTGITLPLIDVEIDHTPDGQPRVVLYGKAKEMACGGRMHLSLTHESGMAGAFCVWEKPFTDPMGSALP